jgi:hypothetical protein
MSKTTDREVQNTLMFDQLFLKRIVGGSATEIPIHSSCCSLCCDEEFIVPGRLVLNSVRLVLVLVAENTVVLNRVRSYSVHSSLARFPSMPASFLFIFSLPRLLCACACLVMEKVLTRNHVSGQEFYDCDIYVSLF